MPETAQILVCYRLFLLSSCLYCDPTVFNITRPYTAAGLPETVRVSGMCCENTKTDAKYMQKRSPQSLSCTRMPEQETKHGLDQHTRDAMIEACPSASETHVSSPAYCMPSRALCGHIADSCCLHNISQRTSPNLAEGIA